MFNFFKNEEKTKDPVCGMSVDKKKTEFSTEYSGKAYYFCSRSCKMTFDANKKLFV